jgi:hypothetical protein
MKIERGYEFLLPNVETDMVDNQITAGEASRPTIPFIAFHLPTSSGIAV